MTPALRISRRLRRPSAVVALLSLLACLAFAAWYRGSRAPVSAEEILDFERAIAELDGPSRAFFDGLDASAFLRADDGEAFYAVNLLRLRDRALPVPGEATARSGAEALQEFSRRVLPIFARHAGHPVFASRPPPSPGAPEQVTVVRYRSRRDWMSIVTSEAYLDALPHRLAAVEEGTRLTLSGRQLPAPILVVVCVGVGLVCLAFAWEGHGRALRG